MKLNNLPLIRKRMAILGVTAFAAAGAAHAQFTGIGTTTPDASLHVYTAPADTAAIEPIKIESVKALPGTAAAKASYGEVLVYDNATGLFRREAIAELLSDNGEWVYDAGVLTPRRADVAPGLTLDGTAGAEALGIGFPTTVNNTLTVGAFATSLGGDLAVAGNTALAGDATVTGNAVLEGLVDIDQDDLADVTAGGTTPVLGTEFLLLQQPGNDRVQYVTIDEMISNSGYWVDNGTVVGTPIYQPRGIESTMSVTAGAVAVTGTFDVNGDVTVAPTNTVTFPAANVTAPVNADQILIQRAGSDLVNHVTVQELLTTNGQFVNDGTNIVPRDPAYANSVAIGTAAVTIGVPTQVNSTLSIAQADVADANATTPIDGTERILIQDGSDLVQHVTIDDLISNAGYWSFDEATNTLQPSDADVADELVITDGLTSIGNAAVTGTVTLTPGADGLTVNDLAPVFDVATAGVGATAGSVFERVMITDHDGFVRYIDAGDLVASAAEWVYDATNTRIYARRAQANGADVWVTDAGNHVVELAASYQFADATNQVTATGITSSTGYALTTAATNDVTFSEGTEPWLVYDATDAAWDATERGRVGINTAAPAATLHVAGNIVASNSTVTSDRRFKRDVEDFSGALEAVKALRGVSYSFRGDEFPAENFDDAQHLGFIAQEIREVLPQTVVERGDGYLTVDYAAVTPVLAEALEELAAKVETLEAENASLKASPAVGAAEVISELEARIADLDARLDEVAGRK